MVYFKGEIGVLQPGRQSITKGCVETGRSAIVILYPNMCTVPCPVCYFAYARTNSTNRIRKAHAGVQAAWQDAEACGLAACSCSQMVLTAAALKKHQGIRHCQSVTSEPETLIDVPPTLPEMQQEVETVPEEAEPVLALALALAGGRR